MTLSGLPITWRTIEWRRPAPSSSGADRTAWINCAARNRIPVSALLMPTVSNETNALTYEVNHIFIYQSHHNNIRSNLHRHNNIGENTHKKPIRYQRTQYTYHKMGASTSCSPHWVCGPSRSKQQPPSLPPPNILL